MLHFAQPTMQRKCTAHGSLKRRAERVDEMENESHRDFSVPTKISNKLFLSLFSLFIIINSSVDIFMVLADIVS